MVHSVRDINDSKEEKLLDKSPSEIDSNKLIKDASFDLATRMKSL